MYDEREKNRGLKAETKPLSYGVVTEQGDMGLGFSVLNESDQKAAQEHNDKRDKE